jgi:hypothetical protein
VAETHDIILSDKQSLPLSELSAWPQAEQQSPLFQFIVSWGPRPLAQCTGFNILFVIILFI